MKKALNKLKKINIVILFNNIIYLLTHKLRYEIIDNNQLMLTELNYKLQVLKDDLTYRNIIDYFSKNTNHAYQSEVDFIRNIEKVTFFPYEKINEFRDIICEYDSVLEMPYVLHDLNKKLYFPKFWSKDKVKLFYKNYTQIENIVGGGCLSKSPHQYQSENIFVKNGDLLVDIGAAEALFSLDVIEKVKKVIIIESDEIWFEPLRATFSPYGNKVVIINKKVSTRNSESEVTLETCLQHANNESIFIKMDIEGYETTLIENNINLFSTYKNVSVSCCTYHKHNDASVLEDTFKSLNYNIEFSDGYMLFLIDEFLAPPFFRKGLIRAEKKE